VSENVFLKCRKVTENVFKMPENAENVGKICPEMFLKLYSRSAKVSAADLLAARDDLTLIQKVILLTAFIRIVHYCNILLLLLQNFPLNRHIGK
jgi:hypothetical protein